MSLSFSVTTGNQASSGPKTKPFNREVSLSTGVVNHRPKNYRAGSGGGVGGFSTSLISGSPYRSPSEILYPAEKPFLSPYTSLGASPVRRIRGLATLNLHKPEYNNVFKLTR